MITSAKMGQQKQKQNIQNFPTITLVEDIEYKNLAP